MTSSFSNSPCPPADAHASLLAKTQQCAINNPVLTTLYGVVGFGDILNPSLGSGVSIPKLIQTPERFELRTHDFLLIKPPTAAQISQLLFCLLAYVKLGGG